MRLKAAAPQATTMPHLPGAGVQGSQVGQRRQPMLPQAQPRAVRPNPPPRAGSASKSRNSQAEIQAPAQQVYRTPI